MDVVVTCKNRRGDLRRWCESIKAQNVWPVIVDYNSLNPLTGKEKYLPPGTQVIRVTGGDDTKYPEASLKNIGIKFALGRTTGPGYFSDSIACTNIDIVYQKDFFYEIGGRFRENVLVQAIRLDSPEGSFVTPDGQIKGAQGSTIVCLPMLGGIAVASGDCQAMMKKDWEKLNGYNENMLGWGVLDNDLTTRAIYMGFDVNIMGYLGHPNHIHCWHPITGDKTEEHDRNVTLALESYNDHKWRTDWKLGEHRNFKVEAL